jgi:hypothetical protein
LHHVGSLHILTYDARKIKHKIHLSYIFAHNISVFSDDTPPLLSCPQSYVIELVDRQESYAVNFNDTRRRVNASDASGDVRVHFIPERATIPIGSFENVTVVATDRSGNQATCHFQVRF